MRHWTRMFAVMAIGLASMLIATDFAEARRAGGMSGFGSRGTRTFSAPATTNTAPTGANGIQRSMTPQNSATQGAAARAPAQQANRGGLFGGMAGGILGGLAMGGLIGMLMGSGFGGGFGFLGMLLQIGLLAMLAMFLFRRFGSQQAPAGAGSAGGMMRNSGNGFSGNGGNSGLGGFQIPKMGSGANGASGAFGSGFGGSSAPASKDIEVGNDDLEIFESMLKDVQKAYSNEDYASLRTLATPEAMSYLAEELSDNATQGRRNVVRDVQLLQGDVSEAWSEGSTEYATVAMRYESVDYMVDRTTNEILLGETDEVGESVEIWTFRRDNGDHWKVSAIQSTN